MPIDYTGMARDASRVLISLRNSLNSSQLNQRFPQDVDKVKGLYLAFEALRFSFDARLQRNSSPINNASWAIASEEVLEGLSDVLENRDFRDLLDVVQFRLVPPAMRSLSGHLRERFVGQRLNLHSAILMLGDGITEFRLAPPADTPLELERAERIKSVVPARQGIAPLQFDIQNNRIVVVPQPTQPLPEDRSNVVAARAQLIEAGQKIVEQLANSNCDRRLLENVEELQIRLEQDVDIVRLGLTGIGCDIMADAFVSELPTAVAGMLKAQTFGISMYVGQFPEWHRFTEQAATAQLTEADVPVISAAAARLISDLRAAPNAADPEVPRVLEALSKLIEDPRRAGKRAIYAVWRSIENLVIKVFRFGADFVEQTASKTSSKLSTAVANATVAVLMSAALAAAVALTPVASHIAESAWISRAVDVVQEQITSLK